MRAANIFLGRENMLRWLSGSVSNALLTTALNNHGLNLSDCIFKRQAQQSDHTFCCVQDSDLRSFTRRWPCLTYLPGRIPWESLCLCHVLSCYVTHSHTLPCVTTLFIAMLSSLVVLHHLWLHPVLPGMTVWCSLQRSVLRGKSAGFIWNLLRQHAANTSLAMNVWTWAVCGFSRSGQASESKVRKHVISLELNATGDCALTFPSLSLS